MTIELTRNGAIAVITLNRPEALNALNFSIIGELGRTIDHVAASDARALLITGKGEKSFCAGADIKELVGRTLTEQLRGARLGQQVFAKLDALPMPSVALLNGFAFGGGLELALACTFRLATSNVKLGLPEIKLGLIPGYGGTQRLPRLIGESRALELIMTGKAINAKQALELGVLNRLVEGDPMTEAVEFINGFSDHSLPALGFIRAAVSRAADTPLNEGLKIEADLSTLAYQLEDSAEGMQAFIDKRPAIFKDR